MRITVNGQAMETRAVTLAALLSELDKSETVVATAVNEQFVAASNRVERFLVEGDRIEIVAPRQGG